MEKGYMTVQNRHIVFFFPEVRTLKNGLI